MVNADAKERLKKNFHAGAGCDLESLAVQQVGTFVSWCLNDFKSEKAISSQQLCKRKGLNDTWFD